MVTLVSVSDLHKSQGGGRSQCSGEQHNLAGNLLGELSISVHCPLENADDNQSTIFKHQLLCPKYRFLDISGNENLGRRPNIGSQDKIS